VSDITDAVTSVLTTGAVFTGCALISDDRICNDCTSDDRISDD
jgi:hypothetical protein